MLFNLNESSPEPLHNQIFRQIGEKVISGVLRNGDGLLPVRALARIHHISPVTVDRAYGDLENAGIIASESSGKFFVAFRSGGEKRAIAGKRLFGFDSPAHVIDAFTDDGCLQIAAYHEPAAAGGGDFYDYFQIDENRFGLVIAEAGGRGIPAAPAFSRIQALLKNELRQDNAIRKTVTAVNDQAKGYVSAQNFITVCFGIIDKTTGVFEYVNAGHCYPVLVRKNGTTGVLAATCPAPGIINDNDVDTGTVNLCGGDSIIFYTGGVTGAVNASGEEYGEQRLEEVALRNRGRSAREMMHAISDDVKAFDPPGSARNDKTIMVMHVT